MKKNFIMYSFSQILSIILPFILTPYVARVIGPEGIGVYSYTYSITYYFMLFSLLGLNYYGNRSVAKVRDNKEQLSRTVSELYFMQIIISSIVIILYIVFILISKEYKIFYFIQLFYVISVCFDMNWLFAGLEKFKITVIRTIIIKLLSMVLIFIFVKTSGDLWKYILILSLGTFLNQLLLFMFSFKLVNFVKVDIKDIIKHIKPNLIMFVPVLAFSIYNIMNKIMLGMFSYKYEVGFYENAEKIINIPFYIVSALGTVSLPRISNMKQKKDYDEINNIIDKSLKYILLLLIPIFFGILLVSDYIIPLYLGNEFEKVSILVKILSFTLILKSISQITRQQFLVPFEKDGLYIKITFMGAILNFFLNMYFISNFNSIGACISTLITESFITVYQLFKVEKYLKISKRLIKFILIILTKSFIMYLVVLAVTINIKGQLLRFLIQLILSIIIYLILNFKFIKESMKDLFKKGRKEI